MWIILIFFIIMVCLAVPGFFRMIAILIGVAILVFGGSMFYSHLCDMQKRKKVKNKPELTTEEKKEQNNLELEKDRSEKEPPNNYEPARQTNVIESPQKPQIVIEVKGIEDEEKSLIEL